MKWSIGHARKIKRVEVDGMRTAMELFNERMNSDEVEVSQRARDDWRQSCKKLNKKRPKKRKKKRAEN